MPSVTLPPGRIAFLLLLAIAVAATYVGLSYVQSPEGFQRLVLPAAKRLLHASVLSAEEGVLALDGTLRFSGLRYEDESRGLRLEIESGFTSVSVASLVSDGPIEITAVELESPSLWIGLPVASSADDPDEGGLPFLAAPATIARGLAPVLIPIDLGRARLQGLTVTLVDDERIAATIGPGDIEVEQREGHRIVEAAGRTLVLVAPDEETRRYAGSIGFSLEGKRDALGRLDGVGLHVEWELLTPNLRGEARLLGHAEIAATLRDGAGANLHLELSARQLRRSIGLIELSIGRTGTDGERVAGALAIAHLEAEALNPLLVLLGLGRLASGQAFGSVSAHAAVADSGFQIAADLQARGVNRQAATGSEADPVDLYGRLRGGWKGARELELDLFELGFVRDRLERLRISLDHPFRLAPGGDDDTGPSLPSALVFTANRLAVDDIRRLTSAVAMRSWRPVVNAELSGELSAQVRDGGRDLQLEGRLTASDLRLVGELFANLPLVEVDAAVAGRVLDFRRLELDDIDLTMLRGERSVATGQISGSGASGLVELTGTVHSDDLLTTLEALELRDHAPASWVQFGTLDASYRSRFESGQILLDSALALDGVVLDAGNEPVALPRLQVQGMTQWPRHSDDIRFESFVLDLQSDEVDEVVRGGGLLTPAASRAGLDGTFELQLEAVRAARWLVLFGVDLPMLGSLPFSGDLEIVFDGTMRATCQASTRVHPRPNADASEPLPVDLEGVVLHIPGAPLEIEALLSSGGDQLSLGARYDGSVQPRHLDLTAHSPHIELGRYLALRDPKPAIPPSRTQEQALEASVDAPLSDSLPDEIRAPTPPRTTLGIDITVDELVYRQLRLREAHVEGGHRDDVLVLDLEASRLGGGLVEGALARSRSGDVERYELRLRTKSVELAPLIDAASRSEQASNFRGRLDAVATLSARRHIGTPLRKRIRGDVLFRIRDGELQSSRGLVREIFQGTDLQQLVFTDADARLRIADDVINVEAAHLAGSVGTAELTGTVTLDWEVDIVSVIRVRPGVGALSVLGLEETFVGRLAGLTTVPVEVSTTGSLGDLDYSSRALPPDLLQLRDSENYRQLMETLDGVFDSD